MAKKLDTTGKVLDHLGGDQMVAQMLDAKPKAVSNWRYFGYFPAHTYLAIKGELTRRKLSAPDSLWAMTPPLRQRKTA